MNTFWDYFWPVLVAGLLIGTIVGLIAFRRPVARPKEGPIGTQMLASEPHKVERRPLAIGVALCIGAAVLWHGPLGAAGRFAAQVESNVRLSLTSWEMPQINGHIARGPLKRWVLLSGPADDFQRGELARIIDTVPGVSGASWSGKAGGFPLIVEGAIGSLLGFLSGLLLAYLIELRRRYNAQWNW